MNWRKLLDFVPDATIAGVGANQAPTWVHWLVALYIWRKLLKHATEELTPIEATVLYALWKNRNGKNRLADDDGFASANELRDLLALAPLSRDEYTEAVDRLVRLRCLKLEHGIIELRESIRLA